MARKASLEELLKASFWNQMNKVFTAIPCIVVNVQDDLAELRVDVQPCIDILKQDGTTEPRAVILNVPVMFPATSTSALTMPVNKNDTVLVVFSMRAMEMFSESDGRPSVPDNYAKFNKKDAIAIVGLFPRRKSINNPKKRAFKHSTKDTVLSHNIGTASEVEVRLKANGDVIINSPTKVEVNCASIVANCDTAEVNATSSLSVTSPDTTWLGNIQLTGNLTQTGIFALTGIATMSSTLVVAGNVTSAGKSFATHTHIGSPTAPTGGISNTGIPN
jgi:hypothetical protein